MDNLITRRRFFQALAVIAVATGLPLPDEFPTLKLNLWRNVVDPDRMVSYRSQFVQLRPGVAYLPRAKLEWYEP